MNVLLMYEPSEGRLRAFKKAASEASFRVAKDEASAAELIVDADVVMGNRYFLQSLGYARKLTWMQSNSSGVDMILEGGGEALSNITITCVRGVYDDEVSDHALAMLLGLLRGIHFARDLQAAKVWTRRPLQTLSGLRALVLGWGGIGKGIARRLAAFGTRVEAVRRTHAGRPSRDETGFLIWGPDHWRDALPKTNLLILALPRTKKTMNLVSFDELEALPEGALVVNVARGGILNETALGEALKNNHLGGAALDVFAAEPLPLDHWVWTEERVLMTPHWARSIESSPYHWEPMFEENLRRFASGEPLMEVVDKIAGY